MLDLLRRRRADLPARPRRPGRPLRRRVRRRGVPHRRTRTGVRRGAARWIERSAAGRSTPFTKRRRSTRRDVVPVDAAPGRACAQGASARSGAAGPRVGVRADQVPARRLDVREVPARRVRRAGSARSAAARASRRRPRRATRCVFSTVMPRAGVSCDRAVVGQGAGDGVGLALAGDQEPHLAGAVQGGEGERDPLGRGLGGAGDRRRRSRRRRRAGGSRGTARRRGRRGPCRAAPGRTSPPPCARSSSAYAAAAVVQVGVHLVGRRHRVHPRRVDPDHVEQVELGRPVVAVGGVGRHVALVAPPEVDPRPVDVAGAAARRRAGRSRRRWCRR